MFHHMHSEGNDMSTKENLDIEEEGLVAKPIFEYKLVSEWAVLCGKLTIMLRFFCVF